MTMKIINPSKELSPFIRYYWILEDDFSQHDELVYPTGEVQMLFHYRNPFYKIEEDMLTQQPRALFSGQNISPKIIRSSGSCGVIGVVFYTHGFSAFTPEPVYHFTDQSVSLQELNPLYKNIDEKMYNCSGHKERIYLIEESLKKSFQVRNERHYAMVRHGIDLIKKSYEEISIDHLKKDSPYSQKQYERIFKNHTGLTPKVYMQIVQLEKAVSLLSSSENDLTTIAYDAGFYDQSHFNRKFMDYTGHTPGQFRRLIKS